MMKLRRFDHIDLQVGDMAAAEKFYGESLPAPGFKDASGDEDWGTYQSPGEGPEEFFGFTKGSEHLPNENRVAFWAESLGEVDWLTEIVRRAGGREPGKPGGLPGILAGLSCGFLRGSEREQVRDLLPGESSFLRSRAVLRDVSP